MRRYLKKLSLPLMLLLLLAVPTLGYAAIIAPDNGNASVEAGETINDDLYTSGDQVVIEGTVNGDVYAAGSSVNIKGTVNGDVYAAGQDIFISGTINGSVRAAGQTVRITSPTIGGGVSAFGQNVTIEQGTVISGGLNFAASAANIRGSVAKSVMGAGGKVTIASNLGKDLYVATNDLVLTKGAVIAGDVNYRGHSDIHKAKGAEVAGATHHIKPMPETRKDAVASAVFGAIWSLLAIFLVGAVLLWLVPHLPLGVAAELVERPLASVGWGVLGLLITPLGILLLILTLIGLPLALIVAVLFALGLYLAHFWVGLALGEWVAGKAEWRPNPYANAFIGLLILTLIELIPVIGGFITFLVVITGFGGLLSYGKRNLPLKRHTPKVVHKPKTA